MRNLKVEAGPVALGYRSSSTSVGSGGAVTWSIATPEIQMNEFGGGSISGPSWTSRVDMNLVKFETSGSWAYIIEDPVYVYLTRNGDTWDILAELEISSTGVTYESWTGSVPVEAASNIQCSIYGTEIEVIEGGPSWWTYPVAEGLCVTAWFDGEAGGGLLLYPDIFEA